MCALLGTTGRWPAPWVTALHAPVPAAALPGEPAQVRPPALAGRAGLLPSSTSVYRLSGWPVLTNLLHLSRKAPFKRTCSWSQHLKSIFSKESLCVGIGVFKWEQGKKGLLIFVSQRIILASHLSVQDTWRWVVTGFMKNDIKHSVPVSGNGVRIGLSPWLMRCRNASWWWVGARLCLEILMLR